MNVGTSTGLAITIAPLREVIFGLAIVLFIIFEPKGHWLKYGESSDPASDYGHFHINSIGYLTYVGKQHTAHDK